MGSLSYARSEAQFYCAASLLCPRRKRQHSFHAGPVWLSGLFTKLQVPGQPQIQRVFGQHQCRTEPCALSQLGAPEQLLQRINPLPVCLVMLRLTWNPAPTIHQDRQQLHENTTGKSCHLRVFVHVRVKQMLSWKNPSLLVSFSSPRFIHLTLLSLSATTILHYPSIPSSAVIHFFGKLLYASIYFLILVTSCSLFEYQYSSMTVSACLCTFALFYSIFLSKCNQNSTCGSLDGATRDERCDDDLKRYRLSI